ncbi:MAG: 50S ribosomal protein L11 [Nanoarchaeota archaeon]|nr:50S ribosomal protein L11 [Nanoarchaeota archaeon]
MSKKEKVEAMVEGGKASAAPPLGPALGPLGVNIGEVISKINEKTAAYKGMKVPVTVVVDTSSKEFSIEVGSPPTSALIKKELGVDKGAGIPHKDKVGNLAIEQAIKIAKMKIDSMMTRDLKSAVKTVAGSCNSLGVLVEGKTSSEINKDIDAGRFDKEIKAEDTEVPAEKKEVLKGQLEEVRKFYEKDLAKIKADKEAAKEAAAAPVESAAPAAAGAKAAPAAKAPAAKPAEKKK